MKWIASVGVVVVALAFLGGLGISQTILRTEPSSAPPVQWPVIAWDNVRAHASSGSNSPLPTLPPPGTPEFKIQALPPSTPLVPRSAVPGIPAGVYQPARSNSMVLLPVQSNLPAGVYRTVPYSCIVVVPGPHPDDRCVIKPDNGDFPMPIIKPDSRFIPLNPPVK
ncbi:MAG: hypothetical protein NT154_39925 [Verrucomicrobia bacterium]|nr:hypothetical protein [Verrucomicrobiota bacterium]